MSFRGFGSVISDRNANTGAAGNSSIIDLRAECKDVAVYRACDET